MKEKIKIANKVSHNNPAVRSMELNEVISTRPDFLIRWGMTIFLGILILLISSTFFISYPARILVNVKPGKSYDSLALKDIFFATGYVPGKKNFIIKKGQKVIIQIPAAQLNKIINGEIAAVIKKDSNQYYIRINVLAQPVIDSTVADIFKSELLLKAEIIFDNITVADKIFRKW